MFLLFDMGGTNIRSAFYDGNKMSDLRFSPTEVFKGKDRILDNILSLGKRVLEENNVNIEELKGVGFGFPGIVSSDGVIVYAPNVLPLNGFDLKGFLIESFGVSNVYIGNDATMATYGEYRYGIGKGVKNFIGLTLGTGIGGGIVIDGRLYIGSTGAAGEIGHMVIEYDGYDCPCGNRGCFEQYASSKGLVRMYKRLYKEAYKKECDEDITPKKIYLLAKEGEEIANFVYQEYGRFLGIGIKNLINIFDPDMIGIGGGISYAFSLFYPSVLKEIKRRGFPGVGDKVVIKRFSLGDLACLYGLLGMLDGREVF